VGSQLGGVGFTSSNDAAGDGADTTAAFASALSSTTASPSADQSADPAAGSDTPRFGIESAPLDELTDVAAGELLLPVAPALAQARDKSDLAPLAGWLVETGRMSLEPIEDLTALPCYSVAVEDDDLAIVDGFTVDYPGPDGEPLAGIGYADAGTDTVDPIIRIYDLNSCEPILASTD
jgi:hypothetical protein